MEEGEPRKELGKNSDSQQQIRKWRKKDGKWCHGTKMMQDQLFVAIN